jgi:hypothetical protein
MSLLSCIVPVALFAAQMGIRYLGVTISLLSKAPEPLSSTAQESAQKHQDELKEFSRSFQVR